TNALGHDWGAWVETKAATEDEEGEEKRECQRDDCDGKETRTIPKLDHVHVEEVDEAKEPTCTETGLTEGKHCSVCNHVIVAQTVVPAKGHTPGTDATCTEPQKCTVCGDQLTAALGHDWSTVWSTDETNHWHICSRCDELNAQAAHTYDWVITKEPTEEETGLKENLCTVCGNKDGEEELAKLVVDDNGSVSDLPKLPDNQDYDLEIAVKESESKYNIEGLNKGYLVELFIVDGEDRNPYDDSKDVTLKLVIPDGMEDFTLYKMSGDRLTEISADEYTVSDGVVTIRTTLPSEFVFNAPIPEQPSAGIPWWVWLLVVLGSATLLAIIIVIIVVAKKKKNDDGTHYDDAELKAQLAEQGEKIDELLGRDDGGFNTPVELDENGNVIFK
ncbi:MAG: hypothetical protein K2O67_04405, partial [Clostridia bacterium]|nr:hypothetical protein [Clostridia bacterium]